MMCSRPTGRLLLATIDFWSSNMKVVRGTETPRAVGTFFSGLKPLVVLKGSNIVYVCWSPPSKSEGKMESRLVMTSSSFFQ